MGRPCVLPRSKLEAFLCIVPMSFICLWTIGTCLTASQLEPATSYLRFLNHDLETLESGPKNFRKFLRKFGPENFAEICAQISDQSYQDGGIMWQAWERLTWAQKSRQVVCLENSDAPLPSFFFLAFQGLVEINKIQTPSLRHRIFGFWTMILKRFVLWRSI